MPRVLCRTTAAETEHVTVETDGRRWAVCFDPGAGCVCDLDDRALEDLRAAVPGSCSLSIVEAPTPALKRYSFSGSSYGQTLLELTDEEVQNLPPGVSRFLRSWDGGLPTPEQQAAVSELVGRARTLRVAADALEARAAVESSAPSAVAAIARRALLDVFPPRSDHPLGPDQVVPES